MKKHPVIADIASEVRATESAAEAGKAREASVLWLSAELGRLIGQQLAKEEVSRDTLIGERGTTNGNL